MRLKTALIIIAAALLLLVTSLASTPVEADGGFGLAVEPEELEWGEPLRLKGTSWPEGKVEVSARFLPSRVRADGAQIPPVPPGDYSFDKLLLFTDVIGVPEQPAPGWIEFTVRSGQVEMHRSLVVTVDGRRPPDSAYLSGRVRDRPPPSASLVIVWSPMDDPAAYAFTWAAESGEYQTDYISEGEWFVSLYDVSEQWHGADDDLQAVTAYSTELSKEITLMGRVVTVQPGQPLTGVDFSLAAGPAPTSGAIRVGATPTEALTAAAAPLQVTPASSATANGWLGPALLATGGVLILAMTATTRWRRLRR